MAISGALSTASLRASRTLKSGCGPAIAPVLIADNDCESWRRSFNAPPTKPNPLQESDAAMNKQDKAAWLDEDGECRMCSDGDWPRDAVTCPVCDAEIPDEED